MATPDDSSPREIVEALKRYQANRWVHSLTCGNRDPDGSAHDLVPRWRWVKGAVPRRTEIVLTCPKCPAYEQVMDDELLDVCLRVADLDWSEHFPGLGPVDEHEDWVAASTRQVVAAEPWSSEHTVQDSDERWPPPSLNLPFETFSPIGNEGGPDTPGDRWSVLVGNVNLDGVTLTVYCWEIVDEEPVQARDTVNAVLDLRDLHFGPVSSALSPPSTITWRDRQYLVLIFP